MSESLLERAGGYESVVLVEFPRVGCYSIGFVTNRAPEATRAAVGEDLRAVFLPHGPNPTAGRLALLPDEDLTEPDMTVRRGLRLIITTGLGVEAVEEELEDGALGEGRAEAADTRNRRAADEGA